MNTEELKKEIESHNQARAKQLIDTMFDAKVFANHITRDDMQGFEDLVAFEFQCKERSAKSMADFSARWNLKNKPQ